MQTIAKILAPIDFSSCSEAAVDYAVFLARSFGAAIEILHVREAQPYVDAADAQTPGPGPTVVRFDALRGGVDERMLERLASVSAHGITARGRIEGGSPVDAILRVAAEDGCDLIVVGTHGRRGLSRLVLGSVAESVVRRAPVPVIVVRDEPRHAAAASI